MKNNKYLSFDSENFKNFRHVVDSKEEKVQKVQTLNKPVKIITQNNPLTRQKENQFDYMSNFSNPVEQNDKPLNQKGTVRYQENNSKLNQKDIINKDFNNEKS